MARVADPGRLEQAAQMIVDRPGRRSGEYARQMGYHREAFNRLLAQMNDYGYLFYEDERGGLWPFHKSQVDG